MDLSPDEWFAKVGPGNVVPIILDADTDVYNRQGVAPDDIVMILELQTRPGTDPYRQAFRMSVATASELGYALLVSVARVHETTPAGTVSTSFGEIPWVTHPDVPPGTAYLINPNTIVHEYRCPQCGIVGHTAECHTGTHHVFPPEPCTCPPQAIKMTGLATEETPDGS